MFNRRSFFKKLGLGTFSSFITLQTLHGKPCNRLVTPDQPLGPFYPNKIPLENDADLTKLKGHKQKAKGQEVIVHGLIQDQFCNPLKGAVVEVWQACHSGKYNHPYDTSNTLLDPNFQYYAMMKTNNLGEYSFKTIMPGAYNAAPNWMRPPHIHYKVRLKGYESLTTQLYFKGHKLNDNDSILKSLPKKEQNNITVEFTKNDEGILKGTFIIYLKKA